MNQTPLRYVEINHPWYVCVIDGITVMIRGRNKDDQSGFTRDEAQTMLTCMVTPHLQELVGAGVSRRPQSYSGGQPEYRDVCFCAMGTQLQVFLEYPTVTVVTPNWRSDGKH